MSLKAIIFHELTQVVRSKQIIVPIVSFPIMLSILMPLVGTMYEIPGFYRYYITIAFIPIFLMIPLAIPATICAYSVAGEKENRTMEPLLSTPIEVHTLLLGKSLASMLLAQLVTAGAFLMFVTVSLLLGHGIDWGIWLPIMGILSPVLTLFGVYSMVLISSYARGVREAQELGVFVVLPMVMVAVMSITKSIVICIPVILALTAIFSIADLGLYLATRRIGREKLIGF